MKVVGLDLSLTGTGVCVDGHASTITTKLKDEARLSYIETSIFELVAPPKDNLLTFPSQSPFIVVEGLAYGSTTGKATERAGLWWLVKMAFWNLHIPVAVVAPTARSKFATSKGNAGKDEVMLAAARLFPDAGIKNNNEADATILWAMGKAYLGSPVVDLPKTHTVALDKVQWPEMSIL